MNRLAKFLCLVCLLFHCLARAGIYPSPVMPTNYQYCWQGNVGVPGGIPGTNGATIINAASWGYVADGVTANQDQVVSNIIYSLREGAGSNLTLRYVIQLPTNGIGVWSHAVQVPWENGATQPWPQVRLRGGDARYCQVVGPNTGAIFSLRGNSVSGGLTKPITNATIVAGVTTNVLIPSGAASGSVGDYFLVSQSDDSSFTTESGYNGSFAGGLGGWGTNAAGFQVQITSFEGTTNFGFTPPLPYGFNTSPIIQHAADLLTNCGVEGIGFIRKNPSPSDTAPIITMIDCADCWFSNCAALDVTYQGIMLNGCFRCGVFGCYVNFAGSDMAGKAYGIDFFTSFNTACLVENNCVDGQQFAFCTEGSCGGNVFAYNFFTNSIIGRASMTNFVQSTMNNHSALPWFNLYEGNSVGFFGADDGLGSGAYNTYFGNYVSCQAWCYPEYFYSLNQDALIEYGIAGWPGFPGGYVSDVNGGGFMAFRIDKDHYYYSAVGNIIGTNMLTFATQSGLPLLYSNAPATSTLEETPLCFRFGYTQPSSIGNQNDAQVGQTFFNHGNWDPVSGGVQHTAGYPTAIPASLYLTAAPSWWPSGLAWPPYVAATHTIGHIPAESLWQLWNPAPAPSGPKWAAKN